MESKKQAKNQLVEYIDSKIEELGWNDAELAKRAGVSPSVVSRLLRSGSINVKVKNIYRILDAIGLFGKKIIIKRQSDINQIELSSAYKQLAEAREQIIKLQQENNMLQERVKALENRFFRGRREKDAIDLDVAKLRNLHNYN